MIYRQQQPPARGSGCGKNSVKIPAQRTQCVLDRFCGDSRGEDGVSVQKHSNYPLETHYRGEHCTPAASRMNHFL